MILVNFTHFIIFESRANYNSILMCSFC